MKKSLQKIEDYYINKGLRGDKLRQALFRDRDYKKILNERKRKLTKKFKVKPKEKKQYVLSTDQDYEILQKIYQLEKKKLSKEEKKIVNLIRTQLERDWRTSLIKFLDQLLKKYK